MAKKRPKTAFRGQNSPSQFIQSPYIGSESAKKGRRGTNPATAEGDDLPGFFSSGYVHIVVVLHCKSIRKNGRF